MFKELFTESKLDKEAKKILKWVDDILGDLKAPVKEAIKKFQHLKQGTFKEILATELTQFKKISKFYELDNKLAIDGTHQDGTGVIKQIPFPSNDLQHRKDLLKALNVRMLPKFK